MVVPKSRGVRAALLALVTLSTITPPALADGPRLVRVIWDVGQGQVFYKVEDQADTGADVFAVPADVGAVVGAGFQSGQGRPFLRKGDRVRVYAVNYNPVAHVWHESSTAEVVPLAPSIAGPLINAALLAISGGGQLLFAPKMETGDPCQPFDEAIDALQTRTGDALATASVLVKQADDIEALATKVGAAPASAELWTVFDAQQARQVLERLVGDRADETLETWMDALEAFSKDIREFNEQWAAVNQLALKHLDCVAKHKEARAAIAEAMKDLVADASAVRKVSARLESANSAWKAMRTRLERPWTDDAIPIVVKEAVPADAVVRIDAVFVSVDKSLNRRIQRTLVLEVEPHMPLLTVSTGVGFNWLRFKTLQITQGTAPNKDGVTVARNRLEIVDDTDWNTITPVWLQNIRIWGHGDLGVYGTFGTTPDRNIFENAIVGGSFVIRRWRTTVTVAGITARGYREQDLEPVRTRFSDADGFTIPDVKLDAVPLPPASWKWSPMVSVTFNVVQF